MLEKQQLPIEMHPPVLYGLHHARPLSIIMAHEESEPWFFSHYIQLGFLPEEQENPGFQRIDFGYTNPNLNSLLNRTIITKDILSFDSKDILEYILNWIHNEYYVEVFINESEVPGTRNYGKKEPVRHSFIFSGYDLSRKTLQSMNFNENKQFSIMDIPFDTLVHVYNSEVTRPVNPSDRIAILIKYTGNLYRDPEPNTALIKESLHDYINSVNTVRKYKFLINYPMKNELLRYIDGVFGIAIYKELIAYLKRYAESKRNVDFRIFHALWEHKKIMVSRIEYLERTQKFEGDPSILNAFRNIEKTANLMRSIITKYNLVKDEYNINGCIDCLNHLYETEPVHIENLIKSIC